MVYVPDASIATVAARPSPPRRLQRASERARAPIFLYNCCLLLARPALQKSSGVGGGEEEEELIRPHIRDRTLPSLSQSDVVRCLTPV